MLSGKIVGGYPNRHISLLTKALLRDTFLGSGHSRRNDQILGSWSASFCSSFFFPNLLRLFLWLGLKLFFLNLQEHSSLFCFFFQFLNHLKPETFFELDSATKALVIDLATPNHSSSSSTWRASSEKVLMLSLWVIFTFRCSYLWRDRIKAWTCCSSERIWPTDINSRIMFDIVRRFCLMLWSTCFLCVKLDSQLPQTRNNSSSIFLPKVHPMSWAVGCCSHSWMISSITELTNIARAVESSFSMPDKLLDLSSVEQC